MLPEHEERREALMAKTRSEIDALTARGVLMAGQAFSSVLLMKGAPSAEEFAGVPFSGADGDALRASLAALGYEPEDGAALLACTSDGAALEPDVLREALTALDPATLVLCDEEAAAALQAAYPDELAALPTLEEAMLAPGTLTQLLGMRVLALGNFAAALDDAQAKQRMWARLKRIPPLGEPF